MTTVKSVAVFAAACCVLAGYQGCKKPRKFVRTRQQQERVDEAILDAAPTPKFAIGADLGGKVNLIGLDMEPENPTPGGKVKFHFYWEVIGDMPEDGDWAIFLHVEGPAKGGGIGRVIADHYPVELSDGEQCPKGPCGLYPPIEWQKGQIIRRSSIRGAGRSGRER